MTSGAAGLSNTKIEALEGKYADLVFALGKGSWFQRTGYAPHTAQLAIHKSNARFIIAICGRRMGKSILASKEIEHVVTQPNKRVWIVAPTYDLTNKVFREVWKTFVIDYKCVDVVKKSERERYLRLKNGSEIIGKSADRFRGSILAFWAARAKRKSATAPELDVSALHAGKVERAP